MAVPPARFSPLRLDDLRTTGRPSTSGASPPPPKQPTIESVVKQGRPTKGGPLKLKDVEFFRRNVNVPGQR